VLAPSSALVGDRQGVADRQNPQSSVRRPRYSENHSRWRTARQTNRKQRDNGSDCEGADKVEHIQSRYKMSGAEQAEANDADDERQKFQGVSRLRSRAAEVWSNDLTVGEAGRFIKGLRIFPFACSVVTSCSRPPAMTNVRLRRSELHAL